MIVWGISIVQKSESWDSGVFQFPNDAKYGLILMPLAIVTIADLVLPYAVRCPYRLFT